MDEPDIVKTDGTRIITMVDGKITYVDVTTGEPLVLGTLQLSDGWNHTLFVVGETAFVFANGGGGIAMPTDVAAAGSFIYPGYPGNSTIVFEVDISDPAAMKVARTLTVEGQFLSARLIDGTVRTVISSYPQDLPFVYPRNEAGEAVALQANRGVIEQTTLEDWLPEYTLVESDGSSTKGLVAACSRTHKPAEFAGFETLSVLTFAADSGVDAGDAAAVIAGGQTVYASTENLYVATNVWVPSGWFGFGEENGDFEQSYSTAIHKFSIYGQRPGRVRGLRQRAGSPAQPVLDGRVRRLPAGRHHRRPAVGFRGHLRIVRGGARAARRPTGRGRQRRRDGQGRTHLLGPLHGRRRLRRDVPPDRPAVRGGSQ